MTPPGSAVQPVTTVPPRRGPEALAAPAGGALRGLPAAGGEQGGGEEGRQGSKGVSAHGSAAMVSDGAGHEKEGGPGIAPVLSLRMAWNAPPPPPPRRKLLIASLVFGLFVLCDIALFGWLIFRSLSQREVERVLLETRTEAEKLAQQIARRADREGKDLYTAVAVERETQTYIDQMLRQREMVQRVEIRDKNGVLVYEGRSEARMPVDADAETPPRSRRRPQLARAAAALEPSPPRARSEGPRDGVHLPGARHPRADRRLRPAPDRHQRPGAQQADRGAAQRPDPAGRR